MRYAHNVERVLALPSQAVALLATMMLRGPQTIGELRINSDRLHGSPTVGRRRFPERARGAQCRSAGRHAAEASRRARKSLDAPVVRDSRRRAADIDSAAAPPRDDTLRTEISALKRSVSELRDEIESLKAAISHLNRDA
jgi:uncharacterized protein YceH (UPF0502 family)